MLVYDLFYKLLLLTFIMYTFFFLFLGLIVHFLTLNIISFYLFIYFFPELGFGWLSLHFSTIVTLVTEQQVSSLFSYSFYQCSSFGSVFPGCKI